MARPCLVCHHHDAATVCDEDRRLLAKQLAAIPGKLAALTLRLLPGGAPDGPRVTSSRVESPLPVRLDALSLLAPGSEQVSSPLHPLIRRWSVTSTVHVQTVVRGETVVEQRRIPQWFNEAVFGPDGKPVVVPDDDQVGAIPPREWLDMTVRAWRAQLGHHVPARTTGAITARRSGPRSPITIWPAPRRQATDLLKATGLSPRHLIALLATPSGRRAYCLLYALATMAHQQHSHHQEKPDLTDQRDDPLADEVLTRFGQPPQSQAIAWDVDYLLTWLDTACDRDLGIADFAAELAALTAELTRALGEEEEQTWIGRCPAFLIEERITPDDDIPTVTRKPCGAGLWHEPGWAQISCPRCHSMWDVRGPAALRTARLIRQVWPIDRRRQYTADEIDRLTYPRCPSCSTSVTVRWREVTGQRDRKRTWQPTAATCTHGCDAATRTL